MTKPDPLVCQLIQVFDTGPYCPNCGSSLAKVWWFFKSSMCIQPKCKNCHPKHKVVPVVQEKRTADPVTDLRERIVLLEATVAVLIASNLLIGLWMAYVRFWSH